MIVLSSLFFSVAFAQNVPTQHRHHIIHGVKVNPPPPGADPHMLYVGPGGNKMPMQHRHQHQHTSEGKPPPPPAPAPAPMPGKMTNWMEMGGSSAWIFGNSSVGYYVDLLIGEQGHEQRVSAGLSTGSTKHAAVTCSHCEPGNCGNHSAPPFDPNSSKTLTWLKCDDCENRCRKGDDGQEKCMYGFRFSDGSGIRGRMFSDLVRLEGSVLPKNEVRHVFNDMKKAISGKKVDDSSRRITLGCNLGEYGRFRDQPRGGIFVLGPSTLAPIFGKQHSSVFSLCLSEEGGILTVGSWQGSQQFHSGSQVWLHGFTEQNVMRVDLTRILLHGRDVATFQSFGVTTMEVGTALSYFPTGVYKGLIKSFIGTCKRFGCGGAEKVFNPDNTCVSLPNGTSGLPVLRMVFKGGVAVQWKPEQYITKKDLHQNLYCLAFADSGPRGGTTLGAPWMRGRDIIFGSKRDSTSGNDDGPFKLGIADASCPSQYHEYLIHNMHGYVAPPPPPPPPRSHWQHPGYHHRTDWRQQRISNACRAFKPGVRVHNYRRGNGSVACLVGRDQVGVCVDNGGGHDRYFRCGGPSFLNKKPKFCKENSLWFFNCNELEPVPTAILASAHPPAPPPRDWARSHGHQAQPPALPGPPAPPPASARPSHTVMKSANVAVQPGFGQDCGCKWSDKNGCGVNGAQLVSSLQKVADHCDSLEHDRNLEWKRRRLPPQVLQEIAEDCRLRRQVRLASEGLESCLSKDHDSCETGEIDDPCEWGAQGDGSCGVDREQLLVKLVGPENMQHPLVKMIQMHDVCAELSVKKCKVAAQCTVSPFPTPHCELSSAILARTFITHPTIMRALEESTMDAKCKTEYEMGVGPNGERNSCMPGMCRRVGDMCLVDKSSLHEPPMQIVMQALCSGGPMGSNMDLEKCQAPCVVKSGKCAAPDVPAKLPPETSVDRHLVSIVALLLSTEMAFEENCRRFEKNTCGNGPPVCSSNFNLPPVEHHHSRIGRRTGGGLGSKLREAARAFADGNAGEYLDTVFKNHPMNEAIGNFTNAAMGTALGKLQDLLKPAPPTTTTHPMAATMTTTVAPAAVEMLTTAMVTTNAADATTAEFHVEFHGDAAKIWAITAGAALCAAICAGVAIGAVCVSRWSRSGHREPLLSAALNDVELDDVQAVGARRGASGRIS